MNINVFRIENINSGLGPFQHAGQIFDVLHYGIDSSTRFMTDIDHIPEVTSLITKNAVFGFKNIDSLLNIIRDEKVLKKYGFKLAVYFDVNEYFHNKKDDQVCFIRNNKTKKYFEIGSIKIERMSI